MPAKFQVVAVISQSFQTFVAIRRFIKVMDRQMATTMAHRKVLGHRMTKLP